MKPYGSLAALSKEIRIPRSRTHWTGVYLKKKDKGAALHILQALTRQNPDNLYFAATWRWPSTKVHHET
jgi:hypothetical protein